MTTQVDEVVDEVIDDTPMIALNALDRCDRCNARAVTEATKEDLTLLFCYHHKQIHTNALVDKDWTVVDDGHAIAALS